MQADKLYRLRSGANGLKLLFICALSLVVASLYERTELHEFIETRVSLPYLFKTRDALGLSPKLNPKLKIFTYDDSTFSAMQAVEMSLDQWVPLLEAMDAKHPSAIFIDQIFGLTPPVHGDKAALLARLGHLKTRLITAAFVADRPIPKRNPLNLTQPQYQLRRFFADDKSMMLSGFPTFTPRLGSVPYGANDDLAPYFADAGHALNSGLGFASALLQISGNTVLPHMSLLGGDTFTFDHGHLVLDGTQVPVDVRGRMLVDFSAPREYYAHSRRLLRALQQTAVGQPMTDDIGPGDLVLILPSMFTGNTDFAETPIGQLPGGFVIASLLNSRLRHEWIRPLDSLNGPLVGAIALGAVASLAYGYWFIPALLGVLALWLGAWEALFAYQHLFTSLSAPGLGMLLTALAMMAERYRVRERLVVLMRLLHTQNEQMQTELNQAGEISRAFIPAKVPKWPGFNIGVFHQPLSGASGDWYAFERSPSGRYQHFLMCDISGHGAQAAIIVSTCKTVLSMLVSERHDSLSGHQFASHYARLLNETLFLNGGGHHTTTCLGLTFDVQEGRLYSLCAGHPRPVLLQKASLANPTFLGSPGSLLGISQQIHVMLRDQPFTAGDHVLAYTDGVPFPRAPAKVAAIFAKYRHLDPDSGAKYMVVEARERQAQSARVHEDDISLVWFNWVQADEKTPAA